MTYFIENNTLWGKTVKMGSFSRYTIIPLVAGLICFAPFALIEARGDRGVHQGGYEGHHEVSDNHGVHDNDPNHHAYEKGYEHGYNHGYEHGYNHGYGYGYDGYVAPAVGVEVGGVGVGVGVGAGVYEPAPAPVYYTPEPSVNINIGN